MAAAPKPKEALMPKLTDTQLVILSAAAQRQDRAVLPLPKSLKIKGGAVTKTLEGLRKRGLLKEKPAARNAAAWREGEDGRRTMLVITDAGLQALGVGADEKNGKQSRSTKPMPRLHSRRAERKPSGSKPNGRKSPAAVRQGTKQALLIDLLKRKKGATIEEIVEATGWQPHSVRGAISGALKKKLGLAVTSEKPSDGPRRYRIVAPKS
jgi:DNA-binding MarR family transcriptional regulator